MELRTLRYFLAAAREENLTRAASVLHISQPALSYQIAELEQELGKPLFHRQGKTIALNDDGRLFLSRAQEILALADRTVAEMQEDESTVSGDIRIGAAESRGMHDIAEVIASVRKKHPDIRWHLYNGNLDDVYNRLNQGMLDFAVMIEPFSFENCETIALPAADRMGIVVRKDHPLAGKKTVTSEDLVNLPMMISSRAAMTPDYYAKLFSLGADQLNIIGTGNLVFNMAILAEHGIGAVFTLDGLVRTDEESVLAFLPFEPAIQLHLVFAWKQYRPLSKAASVFLREVRRSFSREN